MRIGIMLLLSVFFCEVAISQKYSDKVIINLKIRKQFKNRDTCVAVFDAFRDCRCFLDTAKKTIDIESGTSGNYGTDYLHFQVNLDLKVKAEHIYYGDLVPAGVEDPFPPYPIPDFLIEANRNPFHINKNGFLLKYKLGENRPVPSFFPDRSYEYTGFINCHHITVHQKEDKLLSTTDSLKLVTTFLKSKELQQTLKKLQLKKVKTISGYLQEWKMPVEGYKLLNYQELLSTKENVLSVVILPTNDILNSSRIVTWRYWENGKRLDYFGSSYYQKFQDKWILMHQFIFNTRTQKSISSE